MGLSTLRQALPSEKLRTVHLIIAQWPLNEMCSLENAVALYVSALLRRLFHSSILRRWHCDFFQSIRDTMPEERFVLVFRDARF